MAPDRPSLPTIPTGRPPRVLMVCLGNICRSPTAEAALREAAEEAGIEVEVDSAGTAGWHAGDPPDPRSVAAARDVGLVVDGASRQVTATDFERFDLVVAMDASNARDLRELAPNDDAGARIHLLRDFQPGHAGRDVPDPYYGGEQGFSDVVAMCREAAAGLVESLQNG